jgi:hypothetical protein
MFYSSLYDIAVKLALGINEILYKKSFPSFKRRGNVSGINSVPSVLNFPSFTVLNSLNSMGMGVS